MEKEAPKHGSGEWMTAVGTGLGQRVAVEPAAGATGSKTSIATQGGRDIILQVGVDRYLSVKCRNNASRKVQGSVC